MIPYRKIFPIITQITFETLRVLDALVGLPKSLSESLQWRRHWKFFLQNKAPKPTLWIHGASVGELEDLASFYLNKTFLNQAGYEYESLVITSSSISAESYLKKIKDSYPVLYAGPLPPENSLAINEFLEFLNPEILLLSHSDLWPLLLQKAQKQASFKGMIWLPAKASAAQKIFENIVLPHKLLALGYRHYEDESLFRERLKNYSTQFKWIGNPRIDRILERVNIQKNMDQPVLESFRANPDPSKINLILGSAWPEDAVQLNEAYSKLSQNDQLRFQIVVMPHLSDDIHIVAQIQNILPYARVIATQGILLEAYQNFDLAFVGGGFKNGLHNIVESLLWAIPTVCGPNLSHQSEAPLLAQKGSLFPVQNSEELYQLLTQALNASELSQMKETASLAALELSKSRGASKRLSDLISEFKTS